MDVKTGTGLTAVLALMAAGCPPVNPDEPPNQVGPTTRSDAVRFLTQATFGPSQASIDELMELGSYNQWIVEQFLKSVSLTQPFVEARSNGSLQTTRHYGWWEHAIRGEDQLRQRLAFAWSQIFVVSDRDYELSNSQYGMCNFYDMLAVESTGNFREMLERVTLHPVMGVYLSMVRNQQANPALNIRPDENFAREVLQLFTIGLHQLSPNGEVVTQGGEPVPAYDQRTVEEFARVFTGWNYSDSRYFDDSNFRDKVNPMTPWEEFHDRGQKTLLNGKRVRADRDARPELRAALDNIFNHPNVGPFLARQLIQRLVTSNPTPGYVQRVANKFNNDGTGVRGNLASVTHAILTDREARTGHTTMPRRFGKIKEPILRLTGVWRAFDAVPGPGAGNGEYRSSTKAIDAISDVVGQAPMRAQSVFNFYRPDDPLKPGSNLVAPELSILTEIDVASTNNMLFSQIYSYTTRDTDDTAPARIDIEREYELAERPADLVDHCIELLLTSPMPPEARNALVAHVRSLPSSPDGRLARTTDAIYGVVGSPFHLVQK